MPEAAEQGLLLLSAPLSSLLEPAGRTAAPEQQLKPTQASRAVPPVFAAAGARQFGAEQQQRELPACSRQPSLQKPRPKLRARQTEACTGPPSSCMPAAVPEDEPSPENECVVCLDARRYVMVAPCGHVLYCVECAEQLCGPDGRYALTRGQVCPLCLAKVYATVSKTFYRVLNS